MAKRKKQGARERKGAHLRDGDGDGGSRPSRDEGSHHSLVGSSLPSLGASDTTRNHLLYLPSFIISSFIRVYRYCMGNMTKIVFNITSRMRNNRPIDQAAKSFAKRNRLPVHLQEMMFDHLFMKHEFKELYNEEAVIDSLPKSIRANIAHHLFYSVVDEVYLFHGMSKDLLYLMVMEMKPKHFPPWEDLILQKEASTDFYILVSGAAELVIQKNGREQVVGEVKVGDIVGEIGVLCNKPQPFTVRTKQLCQFLHMNRTTFLNLAHSNVGGGTEIMSNFLKHLKGSSDPMMEGVLAEMEAMLVQGRTDLPICPCFAAEKGYDLLLHQLLKRGLDANETYKRERTLLHIAAYRGNQNCVALLLEYEANPNQKDFQGSSPLHLAVCNGNIEIVKLLVQHGADISSLNRHGLSSYALARHHGHEDIEEMFRNINTKRPQAIQMNHAKSPKRYLSEPTCPAQDMTLLDNRPRQRVIQFQNFFLKSSSATYNHGQARVTISCPEIGDYLGVVICLPNSLEELRDIGMQKFGFLASQILNTRGYRIEDIRAIRNEDHLIFRNLEQ